MAIFIESNHFCWSSERKTSSLPCWIERLNLFTTIPTRTFPTQKAPMIINTIKTMALYWDLFIMGCESSLLISIAGYIIFGQLSMVIISYKVKKEFATLSKLLSTLFHSKYIVELLLLYEVPTQSTRSNTYLNSLTSTLKSSLVWWQYFNLSRYREVIRIENVKRKTFTTRAKESKGFAIITIALKAALSSGECDTNLRGRRARITRRTFK